MKDLFKIKLKIAQAIDSKLARVRPGLRSLGEGDKCRAKFKKLILKIFILLIFINYNLFSLELNPTQNSTQIILVLADRWDSTIGILKIFERKNIQDKWEILKDNIFVNFGPNGLGWGVGLHSSELIKIFGGPEVFEGSKRTPTGVFSLNLAFGKLTQQELNSKLKYIQITPNIFAVDDIKSKFYNLIVDEKIVEKDWDSCEDMFYYMQEGNEQSVANGKRGCGVGLYEYGIVINHNPERIPGKGSNFFIHVFRELGLPSGGCTTMHPDNMKFLMSWVDLGKNPIIIQLTFDVYYSLKNIWGLPEVIK